MTVVISCLLFTIQALTPFFLELNRMDKVHLDQDSRFQDIEKTISMKRTFPEAFEILKQTGACEFSLGERLFNRDFPGHYCRLVKTMGESVGGKSNRLEIAIPA